MLNKVFLNIPFFLKGNSPEALRLAEEIGKRLEYLQVLVDDAISKEAASGKKLPAPTTKARLEQALMWIDDPTGQKSAIGESHIVHIVTLGDEQVVYHCLNHPSNT